MVKAVTYLRVSGAGQVDGDGFPRQREACSTYAARHGIEIVGEYRDEACSGCTDAMSRDAFCEMVERIAGNGVRLVLVEHASRVARDIVVQESFLTVLRRLGVTVVEACSGLDLTDNDDPSKILIREMLGVISGYDRRITVAKLKAARKRIRASGRRCEGRKPYGYADGESAGLTRLLDLIYGQKLSFRKAAATLTAEGIPSRCGRPWTAYAVAKIAARSASPITTAA
jgi:DNA invertase Pin-like site-specific DNA recombinase